MALSSTITATPGTVEINQQIKAMLVVSNSGAGAVALNSVVPYCNNAANNTPDHVSCALGSVALSTGTQNMVPAGGVLNLPFDVKIFAPSAPAGTVGPSGPSLGAAESFAVLGGSAVTNSGASALTGDLGSSPTGTITGFPPGTYTGTLHSADATAAQAQVDMFAAYNNLQARGFDHDLTGQDLGGMSLAPGVYKFSTSAQLTGTLTLNAAGNANAVWIFQIGTTLTTASSAVVTIINGGSAGNVFWAVGSSATLGTGTTFLGDIIAQVSITSNTGASVSGRLLAHTGAVTLDTNPVAKVTTGTGGTAAALYAIGAIVSAADGSVFAPAADVLVTVIPQGFDTSEL